MLMHEGRGTHGAAAAGASEGFSRGAVRLRGGDRSSSSPPRLLASRTAI